MAAAHHPTDDVLSDYGLGKLAGSASQTVEGHITTCHDCRQRVAALSSDGFLDRLQRAAQPEAMSGFAASRPAVEKSTVFSADDANIPPALLTLETYADIRRLGQGGMGEIFLARNVRMDREEVLKVMSRSMLERTGAAARFEREIRSVGKLNHPNIVTTYAAQQVGDTVVLSMENGGEDLAKFVEKRGPLPVTRACYFIHQAALGLQYAHEKNLVHRDIKPSNLMVRQNGSKWQVKILDFGLAKTRFDPAGSATEPPDGHDQTKTGQALGTPSYMAPEQIRDSKSVDIRADIYALGCTIYYLLTGRPPFVEDNVMSLIFAHGEKVPQSTNELRSDVPAALAELIAKMLAKDPKDRPQTPAEVAKALVPFIRPAAKSPESIAALGLAETDVADATKSFHSEGEDGPLPRKRKTWPLVAVGLVALAIVGLAVGAIFIQTKDGTIELTDLDPDAAVYVDGNIVTVKWADGKKSAEISVPPGTRKIEVKQGDVTVLGESVEIASNGRKVLTARQKVEAPPVKPAVDDSDEVPQPVGPTQLDPGFTPLFNGKDLTNWTRIGNQDDVTANVAAGGALVIRHQGAKGKMPTTLLLTKPGSNYRHFRLRIQGFPAGGPGAALYLFAGGRKLTGPGAQLRVSLGSTDTAGEEIGRVMRGGPNDAAPLLKEVKFGPREPYTMDVILQGNRLTVDVNGQRTADVTEDALPTEPGDIKLHISAGTTARFTAIEIKPLPNVNAKTGFTSLFNGKDLTGWEVVGNPKAKWSVKDGAIVGEWPKDSDPSGGSNLVPVGVKHRHFRLRFEATKSEIWNSRVFLFAFMRPMYRIMLGSPQGTEGEEMGRLSIRGTDLPLKTPANRIPARPWNSYEVVVLGNRITVDVNGVRTADHIDDQMPARAGAIWFHCAGHDRIRYRNIEIQELTDPAKVEAPAPDRLFQKGSVWKGTLKQTKGALGTFQTTLTVLEREGETAKIKVENKFNAFTVVAQIKDGNLSWDIKEARFQKGNSGCSHTGTVKANAIHLTQFGNHTVGGPAEGEMRLALSGD